ncbi:kazrin-like [Acanthaster planci]|uniref:Kazrin-like n=1 Tax=Acanthaster planci TaxID=133434 RepID=A0A8B7XXA8_ACAPL|nr:kazrin-like [Acanthaster planci]XP_022085515.1 kazrin-like [Acanthaster planci]
MADVFKTGPVDIGQKDSLATAIESLDSLNDQIVQFMFTPKSSECDVSTPVSESVHPPARDSLKASLALMRRLLVDAQIKYRQMAEENKRLSCTKPEKPQQVTVTELTDTNKRLSYFSADGSTGSSPDNDKGNSEWEKQQGESELQRLRDRCCHLERDNMTLMKQLDDLRALDHSHVEIPSAGELKIQLTQTEHDLARAKEALTAMKSDRKRLKGEKVDLLNQMKQLYCTLEAKEEEMRDFIRNYEQRVSESDESLRKVIAEKEEVEKDRWEILKRAREAAERSVSLREQLDRREKENEAMEQEIDKLKEQLTAERRSFHHPQTPTITLTSTPATTPDMADLGFPHLHRPVSKANSQASTSLSDHLPASSLAQNDLVSQPDVSDVTLGESTSTEHLLSTTSDGTARSNEDIPYEVTVPRGGEKKKKPKKQSKKFNSLSKIFGKKNRSALEQLVFDDTHIARNSSSIYDSTLDDREKLRLAEKCRNTPMTQWKADMVVSWLEITMCLPQYSQNCQENIKSGKVLLGLSDAELESGMGVSNVLHRRKVRLAIEEHRPGVEIIFPKAGDLDHRWVARTWLNDLGLGQYSLQFESERIDGRVLNSLTKKDLEKHLGITRKFHQVSLLHGIELLRRIQFDKGVLVERRTQCEDMDCDLVVWTSQRLIRWARSIDLKEYADNLLDSGVHGALMVLEPSFDSDAMANALGIPSSKTIIRRHLTTELNSILIPARATQDVFSGAGDSRPRRSSGGGTLGRSFQRSYTSPHDEKARSKPTFRGSLGRALGRKLRQEIGYSSSFSGVPEQVRARSRSQELESTMV